MHWIALLPAPAEPVGEAEAALARQALGWQALRFTPRVTLQDEAVLLEVAASTRLFGGLRALVAALLALRCAATGGPALACWAYGPTAWVALARLRLRAHQAATGQARAGRLPVDALPLATLSAARPHLDTLARSGCRRWGELRRLPRDGVARRFGQPLLDALDMAWGERPDSHAWLVLPERFEAQLELDALVHEAPALLFAARPLLARLRAWLVAQGAGVSAMAWVWRFDARRGGPAQGELVLRLSEPAQDMGHASRLLAEHLAHTTLPQPVQRLGLCALEVVPLPGLSHSLLLDSRAPGDSLAQLVERLSARLGPPQVRRWRPADSAVPERRQHWVAALPEAAPARRRTPSPLASAWPDALLPPWLLAQPLPLAVQGHRPQYQGPLALLVGPQRLEASGWSGQGGEADGLAPAMRDYFIARSEQAGLLWVFRQRLDTQAAWFLHGRFA